MPKGCFLFVLMVLAFEGFLWIIPEYKFERPPYEATALRLKSEMADSAGAFDVIVLGDCTGWTGIRPTILQSKLGCSVYNFCVTVAQTHLVSHVLLNRYLKQSSSLPRLVVFQISPLSFLGRHTIDAEQAKVKIAPYFRMDADLIEELPAAAKGDVFRLHFLSMVPSIKVNTVYQNSRWYKIIRRDNRREYDSILKFFNEEHGFFVLDEMDANGNPMSDNRMDDTSLPFVVSSHNLIYFRKILTLLSNRHVPVLVCASAIRSDIYRDLQSRDNIPDRLNDFIRRELAPFPNVVAFEDMSRIASEMEYFRDHVHLSQKGADVFSEELGTRILHHLKKRRLVGLLPGERPGME